MRNIKETLWNDYDKVSVIIDGRANSIDADCKIFIDERDKIRNELLELDRSEKEAELKKLQIEIEAKNKAAQIEAEDKREKIRNQITIGTFAVTTAISMYAIAKTFKFDQVATVTSTLGRNILNGVIPKMFKR